MKCVLYYQSILLVIYVFSNFMMIHIEILEIKLWCIFQYYLPEFYQNLELDNNAWINIPKWIDFSEYPILSLISNIYKTLVRYNKNKKGWARPQLLSIINNFECSRLNRMNRYICVICLLNTDDWYNLIHFVMINTICNGNHTTSNFYCWLMLHQKWL